LVAAIPFTAILILTGSLDRIAGWAEATQRPSADPEVMETSRRAVTSMERAGTVIRRSCQPNETMVDATRWAALPGDRYRKNAARALGVLCEANGSGRAMVVRSAKGRILARYHAASSPLDDSFEVLP
jgi:hypothetical protein